jgi:UDPglucose--hexose-1-phosphate uridylyltransferase
VPRIAPADQTELDECPFCEGREDRTPPEVFAIADGERRPNTPGWRVRVVPNLYPALKRQEVVVHSPRHARSVAELSAEELGSVAEAWTARVETGGGYVHALINEGHVAGASLPHSHSQLVWFDEPPPAVRDEREGGLLETFRLAVEQNTVVAGIDSLVAFCHPAGRLPYETVIMSDSERGPWPVDLGRALELLQDVVIRLHGAEGAVPWNAWLHHGKDWHIELLPRLSVLAGLEVGAGVYVNSLPPEEAAAILRG